MYISRVICKRSIGPCVFFALISVPVNTAVNCSLFCFVLFCLRLTAVLMEWITNQTSKMSVANVLKTIWNGKENFGFNLCLIICCFHSTYPTLISQEYLLPLLLTVRQMGQVWWTKPYTILDLNGWSLWSIPNFRPKEVKGSSYIAYKTEYSTPPSGQWDRVRVRRTDLV